MVRLTYLVETTLPETPEPQPVNLAFAAAAAARASWAAKGTDNNASNKIWDVPSVNDLRRMGGRLSVDATAVRALSSATNNPSSSASSAVAHPMVATFTTPGTYAHAADTPLQGDLSVRRRESNGLTSWITQSVGPHSIPRNSLLFHTVSEAEPTSPSLLPPNQPAPSVTEVVSIMQSRRHRDMDTSASQLASFPLPGGRPPLDRLRTQIHLTDDVVTSVNDPIVQVNGAGAGSGSGGPSAEQLQFSAAAAVLGASGSTAVKDTGGGVPALPAKSMSYVSRRISESLAGYDSLIGGRPMAGGGGGGDDDDDDDNHDDRDSAIGDGGDAGGGADGDGDCRDGCLVLPVLRTLLALQEDAPRAAAPPSGNTVNSGHSRLQAGASSALSSSRQPSHLFLRASMSHVPSPSTGALSRQNSNTAAMQSRRRFIATSVGTASGYLPGGGGGSGGGSDPPLRSALRQQHSRSFPVASTNVTAAAVAAAAAAAASTARDEGDDDGTSDDDEDVVMMPSGRALSYTAAPHLVHSNGFKVQRARPASQGAIKRAASMAPVFVADLDTGDSSDLDSSAGNDRAGGGHGGSGGGGDGSGSGGADQGLVPSVYTVGGTSVTFAPRAFSPILSRRPSHTSGATSALKHQSSLAAGLSMGPSQRLQLHPQQTQQEQGLALSPSPSSHLPAYPQPQPQPQPQPPQQSPAGSAPRGGGLKPQPPAKDRPKLFSWTKHIGKGKWLWSNGDSPGAAGAASPGGGAKATAVAAGKDRSSHGAAAGGSVRSHPAGGPPMAVVGSQTLYPDRSIGGAAFRGEAVLPPIENARRKQQGQGRLSGNGSVVALLSPGAMPAEVVSATAVAAAGVGARARR